MPLRLDAATDCAFVFGARQLTSVGAGRTGAGQAQPLLDLQGARAGPALAVVQPRAPPVLADELHLQVDVVATRHRRP